MFVKLRLYRVVDPSKKALGRLVGLKRYQPVSGLVEKALSKKCNSRWGITKVDILIVAQEAVNKNTNVSYHLTNYTFTHSLALVYFLFLPLLQLAHK